MPQKVKPVTMSLRLSAEQHAKLKRAADSNYTSKTDIIRRLIQSMDENRDAG